MDFSSPTFRTRASAVALAIAGLIAVYYFLNRDSGPRTTEAFFERNPHLTQLKGKLPPNPLPARKDDEFLPGDYRLLAQTSYPFQVQNKTKLQAMKKVILDTNYSGEITLHSFGLKARKLNLIAEFKISKLIGVKKLPPQTEAQLGMPNVKSTFEDRSVALVLDPSGEILTMLSTRDNPDDTAAEIKVNLLLSLFQRLPPLKPGASSRVQPDEAGNAMTLQFNVSEEGTNQLRIVGKAEDHRSMGQTTSKAAAAGAPDLALVGITENQSQMFDFLWDQATQIPRSQKFQASATIINFGQTITATEGDISTAWKKPVPHTLDQKNWAAFSHPLSFRRFGRLNAERLQTLQSLDKKDLLGKSYSEILRGLEHLGDMTDRERDELFVEFSKALKRDPSLLPQVREQALRAPPGSRERSMALGALGYEGSPVAQAAMVEVFRANATEDEKQKVLTELTICAEPLSGPTKKFLTDEFHQADPLASETAAGAGLALGSSIARDGDINTIKTIKKEWDDQSSLFGSSDTQIQRKEYLLSVMGNSKSDAFLDQVKPSLNSQNVDLRAAALNSLRFAQDAQSRTLLNDGLTREPNAEVRSRAAQAMHYQPFDAQTENAIKGCTADPDVGVKLECYRVLAARIQQPGIRDYLQSRLGAEKDEQVVAEIKQALEVKQ